jgi:large subunit ribosomal protein L18
MKDKHKKYLRRKIRSKGNIYGTAKRPRVAISRSNHYLYVQLVDDEKRITMFGINDKNQKFTAKTKVEKAKELGKLLASEAKKIKVERIVFDRSGYIYHGRIKALAEGLREGGLKF